jgi:hypothetical protein
MHPCQGARDNILAPRCFVAAANRDGSRSDLFGWGFVLLRMVRFLTLSRADVTTTVDADHKKSG